MAAGHETPQPFLIFHQTMKLRRLLFAFISSVILFASCEKSEPEILADITVSKTEISFGRSAVDAQAYLTISSTYAWSALPSADWISLSKSSGAANTETKVLVKATTNETPEAREARIVITSGKSTKEIIVKQERGVYTMTSSQVPDFDRIYLPKEYEREHFFSSDGKWFFGRSAQSEHFILFWDPDYGDGIESNPGTISQYKVDVNALLDWAEKCYYTYVNVMKFAEEGHSILDKHKIDIFLYYPTNWTTPGAAATGSGLEDQVGCLWLDGRYATDKVTVAHEIGHSFQYIVGCDKLYNKETTNPATYAFRYEIGKGTGFWEQTSQWQAFMMVPEQTFTTWEFPGFCDGANKHVLHEDNRYSNYFFHHFITDRYGIEAISQIWKNARYPKDALEVYMAVNGLSVEDFNEQIYEYAAHMATFDFDGLREKGVNYTGKFRYKQTKGDDGYYQVDSKSCPEATGFNVIRIQNYMKGKEISLEINGLPNEPGYNKSGTVTDGGWTVGFVALSSDNSTRYYSPSAMATAESDYKATVSWIIPEDTKRVWAVVAATPVKYIGHKWDDNNDNDRHWPYKIKVDGGTPVNTSTGN